MSNDPDDPDDPAHRIENDRRHRLQLSLAASQCADLLPLLDAAAGAVLGSLYRLDGILAVGSQFFVWSSTELSTGRTAILKQIRIDYRHPVLYGRAEVNRLRGAIRREYDVLWADQSGTLPRPLALLVVESPVPSASASQILARDEVFVAEEYIRGLTLTELTLRVWKGRPVAERETAVARLATAFVAFWEKLRAAGWFYGDLSADNLLIESSDKFRVVDAGSAVPAADQILLAGYTPAFTTPRIFAAATQRQPVPGVLGSVLPSLSKILHFALTGREQFNGHLPDLTDPALSQYSPLCRLVLEMLADVDARPEHADDARDALLRWGHSSGM